MTQFLDPAAFLWLGLMILAITLLMRRNRWIGLLLLLIGLGWWLAGITSLSARLLSALEMPYAVTPPSNRQSFDAIVVLGGGASYSTNEFAGLDFGLAADRALAAVDLARRGLAKELVLGGSARRQPVVAPEPDLLKRWIERWELTGMPVTTLGYCRNTRDEAVQTAKLAKEQGWRRILLVTSAWHLKRAEAAFRALDLDVSPVACDFTGTAALQNQPALVPQSGSLVLFQIWLHEVVGYQYYRLRGWA